VVVYGARRFAASVWYGPPKPFPAEPEIPRALGRSQGPPAPAVPSSSRPSIELANTAETVEELKRRLGKELYRLELDLENGGRIAGKPCDCQPGDSLIYVVGDTKAVMPLAQAFKQKLKKVTSPQGTQRVTDHLSREYSDLMRHIRLDYMTETLKVTQEHPALIAKEAWRWNWRTHGGICEQDTSWVKANDVAPGDFITFPRMLKIQDMDIISEDLAEILGWYLAEGCKGDKNRIVLSLGYHEKEHIANIKRMFFRVFGTEPKEYERSTTLHLAYAHHEFTGLFDVFGSTADNKRLPEWFMRLPFKKQGRLLRGLFLGDGHFDGTSIHYATISEQLAYQVHFLLFRLGIIHSLAKRTMADGRIEGRVIHSKYPVFVITTSGDGLDRLLDVTDLPWKSPTRLRAARNRGWVAEGNVFLPVRKVEDIPFVGPVYNLTVDQEESYMSPHGALHNCLSKKHRFGLEATAEELMSYEHNPVHGQVIDWLNKKAPTFEPEQIAQHDPEYYRAMIPEVRMMRKQVMGTESLASLLSSQEKVKALELQRKANGR